jgi:hypothetical protein
MLTEEKADKIRDALELLDVTNNDHWLREGEPRTGVIQRIATDMTITREEIQEAWPGFKRIEVAEPAPEPEVVDFGESFEVAPSGEINGYHAPEPPEPDITINVPERLEPPEGFVEVPPVEADAPVPDDRPPGTREECLTFLADLRDELLTLRNRVMALQRQKVEAESKARQAATAFEIGLATLTPLELARQTIAENNAARAANPPSTRGTAWQFVRKNMQYGGRRCVTVMDEAGGQTLAKNIDGSLALPVPRSKMKLDWKGPGRQAIPFSPQKKEAVPLLPGANTPIHIKKG